SCIEVVFPNIFHFGECLGETQDLCHGDGSVLQVMENIFLCGVNGISHLDVGAQLFLLEGIITEVLNRFGMGPLVNTIFALCKTAGGMVNTLSNLGHSFLGGFFSGVTDMATSVLPLGDCTGLHIGGEIMCDKPVVFQFPSAFNIGKCLNTTMATCVGTHPNQAQVIQQFFSTLTCVFTSVLFNSPADTMTGLLCTAVKAFVEILSVGPLSAVGSIMKQLERAIDMEC
ncbi:hypothetical protein V5799_021567, partial [Amblyomma americanum]